MGGSQRSNCDPSGPCHNSWLGDAEVSWVLSEQKGHVTHRSPTSRPESKILQACLPLPTLPPPHWPLPNRLLQPKGGLLPMSSFPFHWIRGMNYYWFISLIRLIHIILPYLYLQYWQFHMIPPHILFREVKFHCYKKTKPLLWLSYVGQNKVTSNSFMKGMHILN